MHAHTHAKLKGCFFPTFLKEFSLPYIKKGSIKNGKNNFYYFVFLDRSFLLHLNHDAKLLSSYNGSVCITLIPRAVIVKLSAHPNRFFFFNSCACVSHPRDFCFQKGYVRLKKITSMYLLPTFTNS